MAKLRRMLGNINDEIIVELMRVIETQSKETISLWAVNYVEQNILNIYEKESNSDLRLREVIISTKEYLRGNMKLKEIKEALRKVKTIPKEVEENPVAQASARAILMP